MRATPHRFLLALFTLLVPIALLFEPQVAHAGRRAYIIDYDVPTVPDGDVEIETWMDFISIKPGVNDWRWWIGPRWAPHETVELVALTILTQENTSTSSRAELWAELIDVRWRFFSHPRAGTLTLQVNARIAVDKYLAHQLSPQLGWATHVSRFNFAAQVGYAAGFAGPTSASDYHWIVWSAGASIDLVKGEIAPPLQLGVEAFGQGVITGQNDFTHTSGSPVNLGPTLAVAKGRLWLSAGALFGLTADSPFVFVRGIIGLAL
jgi:hypothetical protein